MINVIRHISIFGALVLLFACGGKEISSAPERTQPSWVNNRPINPSYYIGIGSVNKLAEPVDYAAVAKKNALSDLASEIKVVVKSESFLNTMQVNMNVQEEFNSTIATFTDEEIEGFELMDAWETERDYFVYYRLSKSLHEQIRTERKRSFMQAAYDQLVKARESRDLGDIQGAADLYMQGLFEMKDYWSDVNRWQDGMQEIYLDNTIFQEMRDMVNAIEFTVDKQNILLNAENRFDETVRVLASYDGKPVKGAQLSYNYDNGKFRLSATAKTDVTGASRIVVDNANLKNNSNHLDIWFDTDDLAPTDLDRRLVEPLVESLRAPSVVIPIVVDFPTVSFRVSEKNLNSPLGTERLVTPLRKEMAEQGFRFTEDETNADYVVSVDGNTRQGGTAQGFHVAYLDIVYSVKDKEGNVLIQSSENNIKGLQLNYDSAGLEAYKKGEKKMEKEIAESIIDTIL
ncbi:MAG: LPP20 family lipoprotein [Flavobacteriales bacterium]|nr:LPP20 family lipoprotein [Flavobacteriales bacterium]